jgi:hypothetical protein
MTVLAIFKRAACLRHNIQQSSATGLNAEQFTGKMVAKRGRRATSFLVKLG